MPCDGEGFDKSAHVEGHVGGEFEAESGGDADGVRHPAAAAGEADEARAVAGVDVAGASGGCVSEEWDAGGVVDLGVGEEEDQES